jgi:hypothetical protein
MDNNHADNYVLVLEDRMEGKNEVEVGKLSVVSNIDEKGKLKSVLPKKLPLFYVKQHVVLFQGIFSPKHRTFSWKCRMFFGDSHGIARKRSLKFVWGCAVGERWCVTNCEFRH